MPQPLNLLIVEDNPNDAELLLAELRSAGFEPNWLRVDTEKAYLEHLHERLDLVLSDFQLPHFNGLRALELLKRRGLDVPFILVSGTVGEEVAVQAMRLGAVDYLLKDRLARLGTAVTHALAENREHRERRKTDAALHIAHAQLSQMLEHSPAVLYLLKLDGDKATPRLVSENITGLLGLSTAETADSGWWHSRLHPHDRMHVLESIEGTLEAGESRTEYRLQHKDGQYRWVDDARRLVRDADGEPIELIGVWTDITERKRAEDVLRQAAEARSRTPKLSGKKDLLALLGLGAAIFTVAFAFNLFEGPIELLLKYKDTPVDDFWGVLAVLSPLFMLFAYRRWKDTEMIVTERQRATEEMRPVALDEIRRRQRWAARELAGLVALCAILTFAAASVNFFAGVFEWLWKNHVTPIDEMLGTLVVVGLVMIPSSSTFAYRRWHETEAEVNEHQRAAAAFRLLHDELDKQVQQRTTELAKTNHALRAEVVEHKRTETALLQAKEQTESVLAGMTDVYAIFDRDGRYTYLNEAADGAIARITGLSHAQIVGRRLHEVFPTIVGTELERQFRRTMEERVPTNFEYYYAASDQWWHNRFYPVAHGVAIFASDITASKKAAAALAAERTLLRTVIDLLPDIIYVKDTDGRFLVANAAIARHAGAAAPAALLGKTEADFYPPELAAESQVTERRVLAGDSLVNHERAFTQVDGQRQVMLSTKVPLRDAEGRIVGVVGIRRDITESRKLEEQFRQAQKMEAIGTLAGGIAHDFNNILAAISGYTELARMETAGNAPVAEHLEAVLHGTRRAADLVRQILTFSRRQEQVRQPVQLRHVVREALKLLRATIPVTIEFDVWLATDLPSVLADTTQVHQVVMNLCTNAAHAMRERPGRLTVKLENFAVDDMLAETKPGLRAGPYVRLAVSDTGHGMDEVTLARIFEPFFTTKAPGEGTGLGLSVVHGIMQNHEGAVTVYSHPGEGTTFHLYFPAHAGQAAALVEQPAGTPHGHGERVLYVDDELPLARLGQKILERLGYTVTLHTKPAEALEALRAAPDAFDLVVTDQMMPGLTGTVLAEKIHEVRPGLPIILVTGYTATLTAERLQPFGIRKLILKPLTVETLATTVHQALTETNP